MSFQYFTAHTIPVVQVALIIPCGSDIQQFSFFKEKSLNSIAKLQCYEIKYPVPSKALSLQGITSSFRLPFRKPLHNMGMFT